MMTKHFVNRENEMRQLSSFFTESQENIPRFVFISGEAGVGKATLIEMFQEMKSKEAFSFIFLSSLERKKQPYLPYSELINKLDKIYQGDIGDQIELLVDKLKTLLQRKESIVDIKKETDVLFDTYIHFFETLTKGKNLILFIDNFQWCDEGTMQLTEYLALNLESAKLLFIATYRPEEIEDTEDIHPVTALLTSLMMENKLRTFQVERLDDTATKDLMRKTLNIEKVPQDIYNFVLKETEGNPLFITELLNTMLEEKIIDLSDEFWMNKIDVSQIQTPGGIKETISRRLKLVDEKSQQILKRASILGNEFSISDLSNLMAVEKDDISKTMPALVEKKIIFEVLDREEETYNFDHSKIREVLYESIPHDEKRGMHQCAGDILEKKVRIEEDVYALAHHFYVAEDLGKGSKYSIQAGDLAFNSHAPKEAHNHYRSALDLIKKLAKENSMISDRILLLNKLGELSYIMGDWDGSLSHLNDALDMAREINDKNSIVNTLLKLGEINTYKGNTDVSVGLFNEILNISEKENFVKTLALGHKGMGYIKWRFGEFDKAEKHYNLAIQNAKKINDLRIIGETHIDQGNLYSNKGDFAKAVNYYKDAISVLADIKHDTQLARSYNNLGDAYLQLQKWDDAIEIFNECAELAVKIGYKFMNAWALFNIAEALAKKGELDDAMVKCDEAMVILKKINDRVGISGTEKNYGIIYRFKKDWAKAEEHFNKSLKIRKELKMAHPIIETHIEMGLMYIDKGDIDSAEEKFRKAEDLAVKIKAKQYEKVARNALENLR